MERSYQILHVSGIFSVHSTCFGHLLCPSSGVFYCTFSTGKFHAGFGWPLPSRVRMERSYKTLHVSGILSAHHQEFSAVHSALVSFMRFFDDRFQAESGWNALIKLYMFRASSLPIIRSFLLYCKFHAGFWWPLPSGHQKPAWNLPVPNVQQKTPDDGQRRCPKHVEFYNRINLDN